MKAKGKRFDDIAPLNTLRRVKRPTRLVNDETDRCVPPEDTLRVYSNRRDQRTELLIPPGTDHGSWPIL